MANFNSVVWVVVTVLVVDLTLSWGKIENENAQKQSLLLEETVEAALEQLLNIHPSKWKPKSVSLEGKLSTTTESLTPSYMKDLYQKYSKGYVPKSTKRHTNTIRSILPMKGNIQGEEMMLFNLTAVRSWEDIIYTEVHFFQRRYQSGERKRYKLIPLPQEYRLEVFDIHGLAVTSLGKWKLGKGRRGWQVQDLTDPVQKIRQHAEPPHLLGFKIQVAQVGTKHRKYHSVPLKSVLRMDPSPFLIVFSNESNNNFTTSHSWPIDSSFEPIPLNIAQKEVLQYTVSDSLNQKSTKRRTQRSLQDNQIEEIDYSSIPRTARSINDNELPDLDVFSNYIPQTHPNMLQMRAPKMKKPVHKNKMETTTTTAKPKTIPYPKGFSAASYAQKWVSNKKRKARKNKRKNRKLPEAWHYTQQHHGNEARHEAPEDYGNSMCQRRKFVVDFAEIGWSEWIISPKFFEAHYCTGKCPFPLNKALNPSNHATIQSIVHAIGLHPEVPAPCCVPDVMSSVTLLYFDDDRNVVLKNYPSMTAETCACR